MAFPFTQVRRAAARLAEAVLTRADPTARARLEAARFGTASDDDELDGRRLHGTNQLEFTDAHRDRAINLSRRLFYRSGLHGGLTEMFAAMVIGDGVVIRHEDEKANEFLQAVLAENCFAEKLPDYTDRWFVDGEMPWTVLVPSRDPAWDPKSGSDPTYASNAIVLGRVDPLDVSDVKVAALDRDRVVALKVQPKDDSDLAARMPDDIPTALVGNAPKFIGKGMFAALCLWRINPLGVRGAPLLLRLLDKADAIDAVVTGIARRQEVAAEFAWLAHYAAKPGSKEGVDEAVEKKLMAWLTSRRPGKSLVWPMKDGKKALEVEATAPDLKQSDAREAYECVLDYTLGSASVPRMWFGSGGDTNRATAVEQGSPIHRRLKKLATQFRQNVRALCSYIVYLGQLSKDVPETVDPSDVSVTTSDVATRDSVRDVQEVSEAALATRDLQEARAITGDERRKILRKIAMAKPFGDVLEDEDLPPEGMPVEGAAGAAAGAPGADAVDADPATGKGMPAGDGAAVPAGGAAPGAATVVADTALNGAQIQAAAALVQAVADGSLPEESAVGLLMAAFPTWTRERAMAIVRPAAQFEPEPAAAPIVPGPGSQPPAPPAADGRGAGEASKPADKPEDDPSKAPPPPGK